MQVDQGSSLVEGDDQMIWPNSPTSLECYHACCISKIFTQQFTTWDDKYSSIPPSTGRSQTFEK